MEKLTDAQNELYEWLMGYIKSHQHSPSIRQMMQAMNLKSPAPIQSRLEHLRNKGYIEWSEGKARTIRIIHPEKRLEEHTSELQSRETTTYAVSCLKKKKYVYFSDMHSRYLLWLSLTPIKF